MTPCNADMCLVKGLTLSSANHVQ